MEIKEDDASEIRLADLLRTLMRGKWYILGTTVLMALIGYGASFLVPKRYEATATVFPISSSTSSSSLSQFSGLASLAGISLPESGGADSSKSVGALMSSRILVEALIKSPNISERFGIPRSDLERPDFSDKYIGLIGQIKASLSYKTDPKTSVLSITAIWKDPEIALELCNTAISVLDELVVTKAMTSSRKREESLAKQIVAQRAKLAEIQEQLAGFQNQTAMLDPTSQAGQSIETYTSMVRQKMDLELRLSSAVDSYSPDNPRVTSLRNQIANLDRQIRNFRNQENGDLPSLKTAPQTIIRYQNLVRELEVATQIYTGLLASVEQSKLTDDKDQVYIEVMDRALLPATGKPSSSSILMAFAAIGLIGSIVLVLLFEPLQRLLQEVVRNRRARADSGERPVLGPE